MILSYVSGHNLESQLPPDLCPGVGHRSQIPTVTLYFFYCIQFTAFRLPLQLLFF